MVHDVDLGGQTVARSPTARWHDDDGTIVLEVPKFGPLGMRLLLAFGLRQQVRLRLDAMASQAWTLMDGRRVEEVLEELQRACPGEEDLPRRLGVFVSMLRDRGFVRTS